MEDIERLQSRLNNIRTVEPILDALRSISVSNWQVALRRQADLSAYRAQLLAVLSALGADPTPRRAARRPSTASENGQRVAVLVIGSERGLCGGFNTTLVKRTGEYLAQQPAPGQVELLALGARLTRLLRRHKWALTWEGALSVSALPPFAIARELNHRWQVAYEELRLDAVDVIYNTYHKSGHYTTTVQRLLPPTLPEEALEPPWPPPIVETDPQRLRARVRDQWTALHLYQVLLESAAAEHSARLQLMEAATQNAERLIDELGQLVQSARQQAITQEMQALAVGAGLTQ
ncbi:MAG TPA: FoF1 ATP synthase subunit gamma [Anaerolineae bacterium]|nr:FoF1 ATP synthase subunit gamma [Anaerolineae bacterium]